MSNPGFTFAASSPMTAENLNDLFDAVELHINGNLDADDLSLNITADLFDIAIYDSAVLSINPTLKYFEADSLTEAEFSFSAVSAQKILTETLSRSKFSIVFGSNVSQNTNSVPTPAAAEDVITWTINHSPTGTVSGEEPAVIESSPHPLLVELYPEGLGTAASTPTVSIIKINQQLNGSDVVINSEEIRFTPIRSDIPGGNRDSWFFGQPVFFIVPDRWDLAANIEIDINGSAMTQNVGGNNSRIGCYV